jgi:hypothetical protein
MPRRLTRLTSLGKVRATALTSHVNENCVMVGIEPAYQYQRLLIITIHKNKELSFIRDGYAWGGYGSGVRQKTKFYGEFKRSCQFTRFVDKWHTYMFGEKK